MSQECTECGLRPCVWADYLCVLCRAKLNTRVNGKPFVCKLGLHDYHPFECKRCGESP